MTVVARGGVAFCHVVVYKAKFEGRRHFSG